MINNINLTELHGWMQRIAFLVLFPIGGAIALFRHKIGDGWLKYHVFFQLLATCVVYAAIGVQLYKWHLRKQQQSPKEQKKPIKFSPLLLTHVILGSIVSGVILLQIIWAYVGRRYVFWTTWYYVHVALACVIVVGGITNLYLGHKITHG